MLQYEADFKLRRYFGNAIPKTNVGILIFNKTANFYGKHIWDVIKTSGGMWFKNTSSAHM